MLRRRANHVGIHYRYQYRYQQLNIHVITRRLHGKQVRGETIAIENLAIDLIIIGTACAQGQGCSRTKRVHGSLGL